MQRILLIYNVLFLPFFLFADTKTICELDILDAWTYNYNASHWIEQGNIQAGKSMYGEETILIKEVPSTILGSDFIQTSYGSKSFKGDTIAYFRMKADADVFIIHCKSILNKPDWLKDYTKTDDILESEQGEFELYKKSFSEKELVSLGNNGDSALPMYIVAIKAHTPNVEKLSGKNVFDINSFGAVGDDKILNTNAIQSAIDKCSKHKGGGIVYVHDGVYLTGTLELKSNVTLYIESGAILRGSPNRNDYSEKESKLPSYRSNEHFQLIYAENQKNIEITGGGIIDGFSIGEGWPFRGRNNEHERPRLIRMILCENVNVHDVTLIRSANWTQYYEGCRDMNFENLRVRCYTGTHNQDGIDLSGCSNVKVTNFNAICGDDAVCFKAMSLISAENIVVDGVYSRYANCNMVKIGTETHGNIKNLTVRNVYGKARYGIAIESVDGSVIENVLYENITLTNCASPLFIRLGNRGRVFDGGPNPAHIGQMRNIKIRNVKNQDIGYVEARNGPGVGSVIAGISGYKIENLLIEDCDFLYYGSIREKEFIYREVPENENKYPEFNLVGTCPAYGFYFRHIDGLKCKNVNIRVKNIDVRPAIVLENVENYELENVNCESFTITEPDVIWKKI